jgi:hypothetical protein
MLALHRCHCIYLGRALAAVGGLLVSAQAGQLLVPSGIWSSSGASASGALSRHPWLLVQVRSIAGEVVEALMGRLAQRAGVPADALFPGVRQLLLQSLAAEQQAQAALPPVQRPQAAAALEQAQQQAQQQQEVVIPAQPAQQEVEVEVEVREVVMA